MYITQTHSTSSLIREQYMDREDGFFINTDFQTAGRGQVGNHWESEAGKNLTFSIPLHRDWDITRAWEINIAIALGICDALHLLHNCILAQSRESVPTGAIRIKWPNDIYIGNKKVCGTLIENFVSGGRIASNIVGIGLNVNQVVFLSDAPNPTSLQQEYAGMEIDREPLLEAILSRISQRLDEAPTQSDEQRREYISLLYRNDGQLYMWESNGEQFAASVHDISPVGELILQKKDGTLHAYHLKQVKHIL